MTLALYLVLGTWLGRDRRRASRLGAPALDPALLKAVVLITVELMLVTAIALFFSTFSSPLLSAALTFGLYLAGRFSADLKNFDQVVNSQPASGSRGRLSRAARLLARST